MVKERSAFLYVACGCSLWVQLTYILEHCSLHQWQTRNRLRSSNKVIQLKNKLSAEAEVTFSKIEQICKYLLMTNKPGMMNMAKKELQNSQKCESYFPLINYDKEINAQIQIL